jgi:hypothetical protein
MGNRQSLSPRRSRVSSQRKETAFQKQMWKIEDHFYTFGANQRILFPW